ncbi:MAG TPA: leucyl/phenylalanyl-tRNA--protein transferase, partial [Saprospiraceae bacterium]|nr:leucyl/phenylalanyl-tRNA--protein transferase [Saprospiraceae bacterium]
MPVYWLDEKELSFPPLDFAYPDGLLAVGGDLLPARLLIAYRSGIFPWYNPQEPILWWSPDPRLVLFPKDLKIAKSMKSYINQPKFKVTYNKCFKEILDGCANTSRGYNDGTWIGDDIKDAYFQLYLLGFAHSIEVWKDDKLVGGLYGLAFGKIFFGESMFTRVSNASKYGFISLVKLLETKEFYLIDCQQETAHLSSLGATSIPRSDFIRYLDKN